MGRFVDFHANQCFGKVRHLTATDARRHARNMSGRKEVYRCPHCGGFHVAHESTPRVLRRRAKARGWVAADKEGSVERAGAYEIAGRNGRHR